MRLLSRYLLREHIGPTVFSLVLLTFVLMMNEVIRRFDELAGKGLGLDVISEVFLLSLPFIVAQTLPMAVLVATITVFGRLAADHEVTAVKAAGVDLLRCLRPVALAALLLSGVMVWFDGFVLPETNHSLKTLLVQISRTRPTLQLRDGQFQQLPGGAQGTGRTYYLRAEHIDHQASRLTGVTLIERLPDGRDRTIFAERGRFEYTNDGRDLLLTLEGGTIEEISIPFPGEYRRTRFETQQILIREITRPFERQVGRVSRGDRELTLTALRSEMAEAQSRLVTNGSVSEMEEEHLRRKVSQLAVEYQKKFALATASVVFVLLGMPLGIQVRSRGMGVGLGVSLIVFVVYYLLIIGGERLADRLLVPPALAMWFPNILLTAAALLLIWTTFYERRVPWRRRDRRRAGES